MITYRTLTVDGLNMFYREAGPVDAPTIVLLHGFPSSSHMFRELIPALTHNLAIEFAKDQIRVNTIAPAVVETPVFNSFLTEEQVAHVLPTFHALHPLGRNGQTHDIVAAVLFLASDEASWITGTILSVDGGVMAGRP